MATYIQGLTDFVPDIQPFQPDWGTIDKTLRLKQGRYDQGYANIQNTYSGLLNMPQLKQDQIDKRDKFMKQAFDKIGNLATVDLSLPENVASAQNVFAPLYNDTEFLGNASISKHYQTQEALADSLRQKDGGKEFSIDNLNYVRQQKMDYINDESPESWKKYYSGKRYYEPYYDTKKEIREAMEKFKPSSSTIVRLNGFYKEKVEDSSWRESEIKDYLEGVLSDKAKRQLQIEATVRLGDPSLITGLYKETANKDSKQIVSKLNDIDTAIKGTKDPAKINSLIDLKNQYNNSLQSIQENLHKIDSGDLSYIKANQEKLAYSMYYNSVIGDVSKGFAHQDIKQDITEDTVAFGMWKDAQDMKRFMIGEQNENWRFATGQDREDRRLAMRLAASTDEDGKKKPGSESPIVYDIPSGPGDVVNPVTLGDLEARVRNVKEEGWKDSQDLKVHIGEVLGIPSNRVTGKQVQDYIKSSKGKNDNEVADFMGRSNLRHLTMDDAENTRKQAEDYARGKLGKNFNYDSEYNNFIKRVKSNGSNVKDEYLVVDHEEAGKSIFSTKPNYVKITPKQIFEGVQNGTVDVRFHKTITDGRGFQVFMNGKVYDVAEGSKNSSYSNAINNSNGEALQMLAARSKNKSFVSPDLAKYNKYITDYFGDQKTAVRKGFTYADDSKQIKGTKQKLSSLTGIENTKIAEVGYQPSSDKNKIFFSVQGTKTDPVDVEGIVGKLIAKGFPTVYNEKTQQFELTNNNLDSQIDPFANMPAYNRALISTLENKIGKSGTKYESTFYNFTNPKTNLKTAYRINKKFGEDGSSYYLYPEGSKQPIAQKFTSAFDAYNFSKEMAINPELARIILQNQ